MLYFADCGLHTTCLPILRGGGRGMHLIPLISALCRVNAMYTTVKLSPPWYKDIIEEHYEK